MSTTGCSFGNPSSGSESNWGCKYTYDQSPEGTGASTTGTIYGVYDMNGGGIEHVMGNYNGYLASKYSGFNSLPLDKYYDKYNEYTIDSVDTACNGGICYGHALRETGGWYNDTLNDILSSGYPWFTRGGSYIAHRGRSDGIFQASPSEGDGEYFTTFRVVLLD